MIPRIRTGKVGADGRPVLPVSVSAAEKDDFNPLDLIIDTGADICHINTKWLEKNGAVIIPNKPVTVDVHGGGEIFSNYYRMEICIRSDAVGGSQIAATFDCVVIGTENKISSGVLGMNFLSFFDFTLKRDGTFKLEW